MPQRCSNLCYNQFTLTKTILLFPNNLALYKEEGKEGSDHIIEGSYFCNNVVVLQVTIRGDWILRCCEFNFRFSTFLCCEIQNSIINDELHKSKSTLSALATESIGNGYIISLKITDRLSVLFNTR